MEKGRKKIRICLFLVVMVAVILGMIYYFHDVKSSHGVNKGTLIRRDVSQEMRGEDSWEDSRWRCI